MKSLTLKTRDTFLLVIDVQEKINSVMADQGHVPRIALLMEVARLIDLPLIVTEQYPKGLGSTISEFNEFLEDPPMQKDTFSCFRQPDVRDSIKAVGRSQVLLVGIETHVCVLQTTLDLLEAGFDPHVPHDAVNSRRAKDRDWALHRMAAAGAVISSTESSLFELLGRCDTPEFKKAARMLKKIPL